MPKGVNFNAHTATDSTTATQKNALNNQNTAVISSYCQSITCLIFKNKNPFSKRKRAKGACYQYLKVKVARMLRGSP
ncbi:hypothetical protein [Moraxella lacunata]|uniref:hypothetical protein n=1 Tax=Moraxella lacunata TaxID=477 RepID=UPI003EE0B617